MKKMFMLALCVLVFAGLALAQYDGTNTAFTGGTQPTAAAPPTATVGTAPTAGAGAWDTTVKKAAGATFPGWFGAVDKLGAHQNGGKGCVGCHAPHSGSRGNGGNAVASQPYDNVNQGNDRLWGQDLGPLYNYQLGDGTGTQGYTLWTKGGFDTVKYIAVGGVTPTSGPSNNPTYNTWQLVDGNGNNIYTTGTVTGHTDGNATTAGTYTIAAGSDAKGAYNLPGLNQYDTRSAEVTGIMMCLSCHDGNVAKGAMMTNASYEQKLGLLPANAYGPATIPTLLGNDGSTAGNYNNDHPIGPDANLGAVGVAGNFYFVAGGCSRGTVDCLKVKATAASYQAFVNHYGAPNIITNGHGSPVVIVDSAPQKSFVVCTTCHTPHSMYVFKSSSDAPIAGDGGSTVYPSYFFIAAPYNPGATISTGQASSATQFCRQCHFTGAGGANESSGILGVTTAF